MNKPTNQRDDPPDPAVLREILSAECARDEATIAQSSTFCAAQAVVWVRGGVVFDEALGHTHLDAAHAQPPAQPMRAETPMDIASLTKPLVPATLLMQAVDEGLLTWSTPVCEVLPGWQAQAGDGAARSATILQLLNHSSGLPAWRKFYLEHPLDPTPAQARQTHRTIIDEISTTDLLAAPGVRHEYSDLGYILLAHLIEEVFGQPLERLAADRIFAPLQMQRTRYVSSRAGDKPLTRAAATERCPVRGLVVGTVHDENTNIIGGVSGHAGVFSTARDLLEFSRHLLAVDQGLTTSCAPIVSPTTLRFCWSPQARGAGGSHLGGWDTPSGPKSTAGRGFGRHSTVGHLGFTGTSLWIDRAREVIAILLTNRVYPSRENYRINPLRIAFHEAVLPARDGS